MSIAPASCTSDEMNKWLDSVANYSLPPYGKRVPYLGSYWRPIDFSTKRLPISSIPLGPNGQMNGFAAKSSGNYARRDTTDDEYDKIMAFIEKARSGDLDAGMQELWDYMQTLRI